MRRTAKALVAAVVATAAVTSGIALAAGPSVSITSPNSRTSISARKTQLVPVAGRAVFAPVAQSSTKFFLRRDACGGSDPQNTELSTKAGNPDGGDNCGFVGGSGVVNGASEMLFSTDYTTTLGDGTPLILDSSRAINGVLDVENDVAGAGVMTIDFVLTADYQGQGPTVGTDTETLTITPTQSEYQVPFTIGPDSSLDKQELEGLDLHVYMHGPFADSGYTGLSGRSYFTVPTYTASPQRSVQISLDDPSFSNPITASLDSTYSSWSAAIPTPAAGNHTVYVQATQGYDTSSVASQTFTVKR